MSGSFGIDDMLRLHAIQQAASDNPQERSMAMNTLMTANMLASIEQAAAEERLRVEQEEERRRQAEFLRQQQEKERLRQEQIARQQQFDSLMTQGTGFAATAQYQLALDCFNKASKIFDDNIMAKFNSAVCLERLENYKAAYDSFLGLAGHLTQVPDLTTHLSQCENQLLNICRGNMQLAREALTENNIEEARNNLTEIQRLAPTRTLEGKELLRTATEKIEEIDWLLIRDGVATKYNNAILLLNTSKFQLALAELQYCKEQFKRYSNHLSEADQHCYEQLPNYISQANRGIAKLNNIALQANIVTNKQNLATEIAAHNLSEAKKTCELMLKDCNSITHPEDVEGYINPELIQQSLDELISLIQQFNARRHDAIDNIPKEILDSLLQNNIFLSEYDIQQVSVSVNLAIQNNWEILDGRDISELILNLKGSIPQHIGKNNFLIACCSSTHYIVDVVEMRNNIDSIIQNNIPHDTRPRISLSVFSQQAQNNVFYAYLATSTEYPIAEAVAENNDLNRSSNPKVGTYVPR